MSRLIFLLDENVSHKTLERLKSIGLKVESARTQDILGASNGDLLSLSASKNWILITHDRDFLNLTANPEHGIIVVKIHPATDEIAGEILEKFLNSVNHEIFRNNINILEKEGWYFLKR
ncbi:MAG: DUF5615 family PIN-like protein [Promethearchaeota archaeon]